MGCHFLLQEIFLTQGLNPCCLHWQAKSSPLSYQGSRWHKAVPLSDPESAVPHVVQALYQPGCPPGLWGPVLAIPGVTSSQPCAVLPPLPHHPEATSLSLRVSRPCAWQRGFHAVAGHFRPDTSPEMTQRSDVPEDFRQEEGRGAFRGQLGLSRRRAWRAG